MAGNEYGPRGGPTPEEIANRALEERLITCVRNTFGTRFSEYGASSVNHREGGIPGILGNARMLNARNITVLLGHPDSAYRIRYNTATNTHTVTKPSQYYPDLSNNDINKVLTCIQLSQQGGKQRRSKNRTKRARRKNKKSRRL
jgi:hypothetical protein